jgi:hypothetical protein
MRHPDYFAVEAHADVYRFGKAGADGANPSCGTNLVSEALDSEGPGLYPGEDRASRVQRHHARQAL